MAWVAALCFHCCEVLDPWLFFCSFVSLKRYIYIGIYAYIKNMHKSKYI